MPLTHPLLPPVYMAALPSHRPPASDLAPVTRLASLRSSFYNVGHSPTENTQYLPIRYRMDPTFRPAMRALHSRPSTFVSPSQPPLSSALKWPLHTSRPPTPNVYRLKYEAPPPKKKINWLLGIHLFDTLCSYPMHLRQVQPLCGYF